MAHTPSPFRGSVLLRKALACPTEPLNQSALALQLGVSQQAVSGWIGGRSRPSFEPMIELESLFEIEPCAWTRRPATEPAGRPAIKEVA